MILRLYNLTVIPIFADEAIYIRWSQVMRNVPELRFLPLSDGKQPLFMWVTIPFFKLFSDPLMAGRMVSVLTGIGTTVGVFVLTFLLFNVSRHPELDSAPSRSEKYSWGGSASKLGTGKRQMLKQVQHDGLHKFLLPILATLIYAISPFAIFFDRMALADSMLSMFGVWTFIFTLLAVRYQRLDAAMIAGFLLGGAFLTKSPALYFALLLPITVLFVDWNHKGKVIQFAKTVGFWLVTVVIGYGFYNIQRLGPNFHMLQSRSLDYVYPISHVFESPFDPLKPFLMEVGRWLWILGPSVFVVLLILGIVLNSKKYPRQILFVTILAFAPILSSAEFAKVFTARYIFFSVPYLCILAALALNSIKQKWIIGVFGIFIIHSLLVDYQLLTNPQQAYLPRSERSGYLEEWTAGYGIKEISALIRDEYQRNPSQKIVVGTEGYFGTLPDGLQMYMNDMPQITIIGVGLPIKDIHNSLKESKEAGNKTYLVVNSTRFVENADTAQLKLIASYPKAERPDGSREHLFLFELK